MSEVRYTIIAENGTYSTQESFPTEDQANGTLLLKAGALACLTSGISKVGSGFNTLPHSKLAELEAERFTIIRLGTILGLKELPNYEVSVADIIEEARLIIDRLQLARGLKIAPEDEMRLKDALYQKISEDPYWLDHFEHTVLKIYSGLPKEPDTESKINFASAYANSRFIAQYRNRTREQEISGVGAVLAYNLNRTNPASSRLSRFYDAYHPFG